MGCWRRIEVDDLIPFDNEGKSLLPQTENINELWPILLAKAMLKISCSSQNPAMEITDFNPITALTGETNEIHNRDFKISSNKKNIYRYLAQDGVVCHSILRFYPQMIAGN